MDSEPPVVPDSAGRQGVDEEDALHAYAFAVDSFIVGVVMYIGPSRAGRLLEIGAVEWHDEVAIVHAMPARPKFLRR